VYYRHKIETTNRNQVAMLGTVSVLPSRNSLANLRSRSTLMIKIGNKELIFATTFLVPDNEIVSLQNVSALGLNIAIEFASPTDLYKAGMMKFTPQNNEIKFVCYGWRNPIGSHLTEPMKFGAAGNRKLFINMAQHYIGAQNLAHVFILLGEEHVV
jgi:hypothetical protein